MKRMRGTQCLSITGVKIGLVKVDRPRTGLQDPRTGLQVSGFNARIEG